MYNNPLSFHEKEVPPLKVGLLQPSIYASKPTGLEEQTLTALLALQISYNQPKN